MIKIPKKTFELNCEDGDTACPEAGDEVSLDGLSGKVVNADDTHLHIEPTAFHGEPVMVADPETDGEQDNPTDEDSDAKEKKQLLESLEHDEEHN